MVIRKVLGWVVFLMIVGSFINPWSTLAQFGDMNASCKERCQDKYLDKVDRCSDLKDKFQRYSCKDMARIERSQCRSMCRNPASPRY